jgi:hypothetical protein
MTPRRLSEAELERRIAQWRRDYEAVKAKVADVGFICVGSLSEVRTSCGNPNCGCSDPKRRHHGPYQQLTWKEAGTTVTRRLSAEEAELYREWIANRHQLARLVKEMQRLSRQAGQYALAEPGSSLQGPSHPSKGRSSSSRRR